MGGFRLSLPRHQLEWPATIKRAELGACAERSSLGL